jgi:uncharacterized protein YukE
MKDYKTKAGSDSKFYKKLLRLAFAFLLILAAFFLWSNKWEVHDRWVSRSYLATKDSEEVRENLSLTQKGDLVFRASLTEVDDKDKFRSRCPVERYEEANVLGCYSARKIYVLKVDEPKLKGVEEVTAAHELLHAKFERMSGDEKDEVKKLLTVVRSKITDTDITRLIESYSKELGEGEDLFNEMFAIYGTQVQDVGSELESIYSEYFEKREDIVASYSSYNSQFKEIEETVRSYDERLAKLKSEKESLERNLESQSNELTREKAELDQTQNSDSQEEYQRAVNQYNLKVEEYNSSVERIRLLVNEFNQLVETRNAEALSARDLADKLNANVEER